MTLAHRPDGRERVSRRGLRGLLAAGVALIVLNAGTTARANLVITPTFDSTITSDSNAAAIEGVINNAIQTYENTFADPITVRITFAEMTTGLGQSQTFYYSGVPYATFLAALKADAKTADDATAISYLPNSSTNPVNGSTGIDVKTANARALAIPGYTGYAGTDSTISINTHITDVGSSGTSGQYSLRAVAQHEIDEALGLGSALPNVTNGNPAPEDLFRYSAQGVRSFTATASPPAAQPYFSIDGGKTPLVQYNTNSGGDFGDYNGVGGPHVQDAFATPGTSPVLGVELRALDVIGYDRIGGTPEPDALTMLGAIALGVTGLGVWRRRRRGGAATA